MNFGLLDALHKNWKNILVIGRTIECENKKYHIVGMTLAEEEAKLYIIEPYSEPEEEENHSRKRHGNQRRQLKENVENRIHENSYLHSREIYFGNKKLQIQGGTAGSLKYSLQDYGEVQLFLDMLSAGWNIPEWLKEEDWANLRLVTLDIADIKRLPKYSAEMPVTIKHDMNFTEHLLEKTVTLTVGKSRSLSFTDNYGDKVECYINSVTLVDVWKDTEERFEDPRYKERFSPEELKEIKSRCYEALEQSCPKGMCYIGIEYECSKDISLQFYSKEFLKSYPETHEGSATSILMRLKPDKKTGTHNLSLKGSVIQTAVAPDTVKIPAEIFSYSEKIAAWEETV